MLSLLLAPILLADPTWLAGPAAVPGAPPGRNPALAVGGGAVHAVFRARAGGVGHMVAGTGAAFAGSSLLPGSMGAASQGNKNYPALAVDATGVAHVAWGPPSGPGNGASYARVGADGAAIGATQAVTGKWVESIAVGLTADEVHVLITAIKEMEQPDGLDGVFDVHGPIGGGALVEAEAWPFPNFAELSAAPAPWGGLAVLARWDVMKRVDLVGGQWTDFKNVELPPGSTSVGRPQHDYAGGVELWAAVGWVEAAPTAIAVRTGGPKQPWTTLASEGLLDPETQDGEPAVALAAGPGDERMVAWLAAEGPRLRVALGVGAWGEAVALAGTEAATSFALVREEDGAHRVVFATEDGTLMAGRVGVPAVDETTGAGGESTGAPAATSGGSTSAGETGEAPTTGPTASMTTTGGSTTTTGATSAGGATGGATDVPAEEGAGGGCGCRSTSGGLLVLAGLRRRVRRR